MKVALVSPYDLSLPGGVQQQVLELGRRLRAAGHDPDVIGPGDPSGAVPEDSWTAVGRSVLIPGNASRVPVTLDPRAWGRVRSVVRTADVVHIHEPLMPLASLAALWCDRPIVATFHAAPPSWVKTTYRACAPLMAQRLGRAFVTAVSSVAADAIPRSWGEARVIPNGLETGSFDLPIETVPQTVLFLGRDEPRKGLDVVLDAWTDVSETVPEARLVVAGASRDWDDPTICFEGRVSETRKRELLASSAVFVAPQLGGESFGIVIAEAMAAGCAVVASDLVAFRSVAGDTARFFETGSPSALAQALIELLSDEAKVAALALRARQRVQRFDWTEVLGAYQAAYRAAIDTA